nr:hypothetical protein [Tanacetum cinerariifolium]
KRRPGAQLDLSALPRFIISRKEMRFKRNRNSSAILHPYLGEVAIWPQPWWASDTIFDVAAILYLRFGKVAILSQPWRSSDITFDFAGLSVFIKPSEHEGLKLSVVVCLNLDMLSESGFMSAIWLSESAVVCYSALVRLRIIIRLRQTLGLHYGTLLFSFAF